MAPLALALYALFGSLHFVGDDGQPFRLHEPIVDLTPEQVAQSVMSRPDLFLPPPRPQPSEGIPPVQGIPMNDTVTNVILFAGGAALLTDVVLGFIHHGK